MKVVIPGGSGQVGTILAKAFSSRGDEVVVLSREKNITSAPWAVLPWDAQTLGDWKEQIDGADVVINLAGRSVNCRYTPENRRIIKESRTKSTTVVGKAIEQAKKPPTVWLQMIPFERPGRDGSMQTYECPRSPSFSKLYARIFQDIPLTVSLL